jgi:hypothetical protein
VAVPNQDDEPRKSSLSSAVPERGPEVLPGRRRDQYNVWYMFPMGTPINPSITFLSRTMQTNFGA